MNFVKALRLPHASSLQVLNDHSFSGFLRPVAANGLCCKSPVFKAINGKNYPSNEQRLSKTLGVLVLSKEAPRYKYNRSQGNFGHIPSLGSRCLPSQCPCCASSNHNRGRLRRSRLPS